MTVEIQISLSCDDRSFTVSRTFREEEIDIGLATLSSVIQDQWQASDPAQLDLLENL